MQTDGNWNEIRFLFHTVVLPWRISISQDFHMFLKWYLHDLLEVFFLAEMLQKVRKCYLYLLTILNQSKLKHVSETLPSIVCNQFFLVTVLIVFETFGRYLSITWDYYLLTVNLKYDHKTKVRVWIWIANDWGRSFRTRTCVSLNQWVLEAGASTLSKTKIAFILIKYCPFKL